MEEKTGKTLSALPAMEREMSDPLSSPTSRASVI
jgi:hypothetical protein